MKFDAAAVSRETVRVFEHEKGGKPDPDVLSACMRAWEPFSRLAKNRTQMERLLDTAGQLFDGQLPANTREEVEGLRNAYRQALENLIQSQ